MLAFSVVSVLVLFSTQALGQSCVTCVLGQTRSQEESWYCEASGAGAIRCQSSGDSCHLYGTCRRSLTSLKVRDFTATAKLEIEPSLIKEIAKVHSRFAFAIASVKNSNYDYIKFYMTPKPITIEDVEERLSPDYEEKLLEKQIKSWRSESVVLNETRKLEEIKPVIYEINIQGTKLVLNVIQGTTLEPAYKKLEIDFVQVDSKQGQTLKAVSWRIE